MFQISMSELVIIIVIGVFLLKPKELIILLQKMKKFMVIKNNVEEELSFSKNFTLSARKNIKNMKNGNTKR